MNTSLRLAAASQDGSLALSTSLSADAASSAIQSPSSTALTRGWQFGGLTVVDGAPPSGRKVTELPPSGAAT
jgi:hypothetical protein